MQEINRETFTAAMEKAVEDRGPDYVYEENGKPISQLAMCHYFLDSEEGMVPACLIGTALANLGFDPVDDRVDGTFYNNSARSVMFDLGAGRDEALVAAAEAAQTAQDGGATWGYALETYKEVLGR